MKSLLLAFIVCQSGIGQVWNVGHPAFYAPTSGITNVTGGLVTWLKFDENSGNASDSGTVSGSSTNTGVNTSVTYTTGKFGNAASFNGTSSFFDCGRANSCDLQVFTVSFWFKTSSATQVPISHGDTTADQFGFNASMFPNTTASDLAFEVCKQSPQAATFIVSSTTSVNDNTWHNALVTWTGSVLAMYIDGSSRATSSSSALTISYSQNLMVGKAAGGTAFFFSGLIDDVRIYNRVLNSTEISQIQNWNGL